MRLELPGQVPEHAAHPVRLAAHKRPAAHHGLVKIDESAAVVVAVALERGLAAGELLEALDLFEEEGVARRAHGRRSRRAARLTSPRSGLDLRLLMMIRLPGPKPRLAHAHAAGVFWWFACVHERCGGRQHCENMSTNT